LQTSGVEQAPGNPGENLLDILRDLWSKSQEELGQAGGVQMQLAACPQPSEIWLHCGGDGGEWRISFMARLKDMGREEGGRMILSHHIACHDTGS